MKAKRILAIAVATSALSIAATAGDHVLPGAGGVHPPLAPTGHAQTKVSVPVGTYVYGQPVFARHVPPPPPPVFATLPYPSSPYASRLMNHALMVASYANYAADHARLFAPNYAVTAWTDRVWGIVDGGYGAVDGWTAAAYGLPKLHGPRRRGESAPDLSAMPALRAHPELDQAPVFEDEVF